MCHIIIYFRFNTVSRNDLPLNVRRMLVFILPIPAQQGITFFFNTGCTGRCLALYVLLFIDSQLLIFEEINPQQNE